MEEDNQNQNQQQGDFIQQYNQKRANMGLPKIHHVWCHLCKTANKHFWFECSHLVCTFCHGQHPYWTCQYFNCCQWCSSTQHVSGECNDKEGLVLKAGTRRKCFRCGRFGHIAESCNAVSKRRGKRFRLRRRRRVRRNFRRRRYQ